MSVLVYILIATVVVSLISVIGSIFLIKKDLLTQKLLSFFVSFGAGVMLATAFFDLLPEAFELNTTTNILVYTFYGIILFFFMERFFLWFHHHDSDHDLKATPMLIIFGDGMHNLIDGIAIAASYLTSPIVGISTTLAIIVHEIPQELSDFSILVKGGYSYIKALTLNLLSALTAIIGAILAYHYLNSINSMLPNILGFSAGMFIYIACSDLIPDMHHEFKEDKRLSQSMPFILGIILTILITTCVE